MNGSGSNPWPAFADLLFMLFVTTLISSAVITTWARQSEDRLRGCGASKRFMDDFARCAGATSQESENACKVSLGDSQLRFAIGKNALEGKESQDFGLKVAYCLHEALLSAESDAVLYSSIEFVSIDGYTDCRGYDKQNLILGADRARAIYELVLAATDEAYAVSKISADQRRRVLAKLVVRSFGRSRTGDPCVAPRVLGDGGIDALATDGSDADRRVDIAVNSKLSEAR